MNTKTLNIVLVSLDASLAKETSQLLASKLDMHFLDCKAHVEYDLIDSGAILEQCGIEYLKKREKHALLHALSFENTILSCDFDLFKNNHAYFKRSLLCYLKLPEKHISKKEVINKLAFSAHDEFLQENCDVVCKLDNSKVNNAVDKVIKVLGEYYEN